MNLNKLRSDAQKYAVSPEESTWFKLDAKLEKQRNTRKINIYKNISIAAVMVAILGITSLFVIQMKENNTFNSYQVSDLTIIEKQSNEVNIYEIAKLIELKTAYQKLNSTEKI